MMKMQLKPKRVVVVASISLALLATTVIASEKHGHGAGNASTASPTSMQTGHSSGGMMGENMMDGGMMGGDMMKSMHAMMHASAGGGMMSGGGMMGSENLSYDTNDDGTTSVEELREGLLAELTDFDADSNGVLDIGEFEQLNAARNRNDMVDRFQVLDEDGDGQVTQDEMTAPAVKMQRRMNHQAKSEAMQGMQGMQGMKGMQGMQGMKGMQGGAVQPSEDEKE